MSDYYSPKYSNKVQGTNAADQLVGNTPISIPESGQAILVQVSPYGDMRVISPDEALSNKNYRYFKAVVGEEMKVSLVIE